MFELAQDDGALDALEGDIAALDTALADSDDLRDLIASPIYGRDETEAAIGAVASAMGLGQITTNTLRLMAQKRRLFILPALLAEVRALIAAHKGEVAADIVSARSLTDAQKVALQEALSASVGRDVKLNATVDESLIGGLVVKVGSRMIDTSIKAKLLTLKNTMKEVG